MGAWIEIVDIGSQSKKENVAPLVGAWIEIKDDFYITEKIKSLPLWERGLK